ncbi:unnamed protein product [Cylicocyclus nassatus]|uniref:MADF domain-containing protein n=1 Tax=Cylicocyclus nassatus TaxID=53992 RepID=A0AA36HAU9_CYLNA|nr:unnamed protein product [Cylicocyclus nassatus]
MYGSSEEVQAAGDGNRNAHGSRQEPRRAIMRIHRPPPPLPVPKRTYTRVTMSYPAKILLIKLVKQHEELWNSRSPHYSRADIKKQAWEEISARMAANGFESNIGRLRVIWKNLRDQWKRNLSLKAQAPPEKEWYFQRRINFLAETYDDGGRGGLIYCSHNDDNDDDSPDMCEAPNDSLYSVKPDVYVYDSLEKDYATEGSLLLGSYHQNNSPAPNIEPKMEKQDDGLVCGETLLNVMEEQVNGGGSSSHPVNSARPTTSSTPDSGPRVKRSRKEIRSEGSTDSKIQESTSSNVQLSPRASSKEPDNGVSQQSENKSENKGDKFDKYAAFVASTLREMPEDEARRRMKEMTMLLLEGLD